MKVSLWLLLKITPIATIDLVEYGPLKPPAEQGYSEEQLEEYSAEETVVAGKTEIFVNGMKMLLNADPTGRRMGVGTFLQL